MHRPSLERHLVRFARDVVGRSGHDTGRARGRSCNRVDDGRKRIVIDAYCFRRVAGLMRCRRNDSGYRLADEAHRIDGKRVPSGRHGR
jgi:hypothetical protein